MGCPWHRMHPEKVDLCMKVSRVDLFFVGIIRVEDWNRVGSCMLYKCMYIYIYYIYRISSIAVLISFEGFTEIKNPRMFWETSCAQCLTFFLQPIKQQTPSFAQIIVRFRVTNPSTGHWRLHAVDGSEIPNKHLEYLKCWNPVNNGINYDKLP